MKPPFSPRGLLRGAACMGLICVCTMLVFLSVLGHDYGGI